MPLAGYDTLQKLRLASGRKTLASNSERSPHRHGRALARDALPRVPTAAGPLNVANSSSASCLPIEKGAGAQDSARCGPRRRTLTHLPRALDRRRRCPAPPQRPQHQSDSGAAPLSLMLGAWGRCGAAGARSLRSNARGRCVSVRQLGPQRARCRPPASAEGQRLAGINS